MADHDHRRAAPSPWIIRFADLVPAGGAVLDVACGSGRHVEYFLARGHPVTAVDKDLSGLADLAHEGHLECLECDLETGARPPFAGRRFAAVVVTNYLYRPLLPALAAAVADDGVLLYETFGHGNARFGHPRRPAFLAKPGELFRAFDGHLTVLVHEHLIVDEPRPAVVQRVVAVNRCHHAHPAPETDDPR